ncbi:MAG: hypothetical protein GC204_11245 [Chloroflexi bacterium]|nr:hypothetical protein [Chloroflexota bacterium]
MSDNRSANSTSRPPDSPVAALTFVAVPADPRVEYTLDQLLSIFGGTDRLNAERDLIRLLALRTPLQAIQE